MAKLRKWKYTDSKVVYKNKLFKIKKEKCIVPRTGKYYDYFYEDSQDWVNIVPVTDTGKVILIRQYRHAVREFTLEIPGGIIDRGEKPLAGAKRELLEETGYGNGKFKLIGHCRPNPAIINNMTYSFLATGVKKISGQHFDGTEEIEVLEVPVNKIEKLITSGKITHTLVITALHFALPYLK
jgi:ADP-ribose pyrophosphatase